MRLWGSPRAEAFTALRQQGKIAGLHPGGEKTGFDPRRPAGAGGRESNPSLLDQRGAETEQLGGEIAPEIIRAKIGFLPRSGSASSSRLFGLGMVEFNRS